MLKQALGRHAARNIGAIVTVVLVLGVFGAVGSAYLLGARPWQNWPLYQAMFGPEPVEEVAVVNRGLAVSEAVASFHISGLTYNYTTVAQQVSALGRNCTVVEYESELTCDIRFPGTTSYLGVEVQGSMELGIDGNDIRVIVNSDDNPVIVQLPEAEILSHSFSDDFGRIIFNIGTVFNSNTPEEYRALVNSERAKIVEEVQASDMLTQAHDNAVNQLSTFLNSLPGLEGQVIVK